MNYYNIKHKDEIVSFKEATLRGLGKNKGLFVPEHIPSLSLSPMSSTISSMATQMEAHRATVSAMRERRRS